MQQIFVNSEDIFFENGGKIVTVEDKDANHLINVLRMKKNDSLRVSTTQNESFIGHILRIEKDTVYISLDEVSPQTELSNKIYLFQAIPKGDRMENVIEKCVELGVYEIIPVEMKHCVVRLDEKKKEKRLLRYRSLAEAAAKQSKRSVIPQIHDFMTFHEAHSYAKECDINIVPYENATGMLSIKNTLEKIKEGMSISVFIGPEGGFAAEEIEVLSDFDIVSLGRRILRTDTASILACGLVMTKSEIESFKKE